MTENDLLKLAALHFYITAKQNKVEMPDKYLILQCIEDSKKILNKIDLILNKQQSVNNKNNENN